jgi:hypothetical protein
MRDNEALAEQVYSRIFEHASLMESWLTAMGRRLEEWSVPGAGACGRGRS